MLLLVRCLFYDAVPGAVCFAMLFLVRCLFCDAVPGAVFVFAMLFLVRCLFCDAVPGSVFVLRYYSWYGVCFAMQQNLSAYRLHVFSSEEAQNMKS